MGHYFSIDFFEGALALLTLLESGALFFDDKNFREMIVKGCAINFEIIPDKNKIVVFGLHKWENELNL